MAKYQIATWGNYDLGDVKNVSTPDLRKAVERAGKAANARLRALEKAGLTGGMYKNALADLGLPRKRFKESAKTATRAQLLREYVIIRNFMSAKTSTPSGVRSANRRRYMTAAQRGFQGTEEEFYDLVEQYFSKETEKIFSSDVIYDIITGVSGKKKRSVVDEILSQKSYSKGQALLEYQERIDKE